MIFGYSIPQSRKFVISVLMFAAVIAAFFIHFNPNLTQALAVLVGAIFGVVGVFTAKHHSADDMQKALEHMKGAALAVVGFFATVPSSVNLKISAAIGVFVTGLAIYYTRNAPTTLPAVVSAPPAPPPAH